MHEKILQITSIISHIFASTTKRIFSRFQVQHQIAQAAQQLQQLQKAQQQQNTNHQHNTSIPQNAPHPQQTQTTPPNTAHNIPASLLTPSTPSSGGLTPQHLKTPSRILEPSPEETTDLEELEQFAKTFKQRRIKLGKNIKIFKIYN